MIFEYDTNLSIQRPHHVNTIYSKSPIVDMALYPYRKRNHQTTLKSSKKDLVIDMYPDRVMLLHSDRSVYDMPKHRYAPLALSQRDGRLVHALGKMMWIGSTSEGPAAIEKSKVESQEDISATMMQRARCSQDAKYSMDASSNIKVLSNDDVNVHGSTPSTNHSELLRLWTWVERVESFCSEALEDTWDDISWPAKSLIDAGALTLLQNDNDCDFKSYSETLSCTQYTSPGRRATLVSCGWAGKTRLVNVLSECETSEEYERAAALAVWHGDIEVAVDSLQRGADFIRNKIKSISESSETRSLRDYAELLELTAFCIAGYRGNDLQSPSYKLWQRSCSGLFERCVSSDASSTSRDCAYIVGVLKFLMCVGNESSPFDVVHYTKLSLCDRVAFACRFLPRNELMDFLQQCVAESQKYGNIEGVTIAGLGKEGIKILQSYVDFYSDVQTAALVTSRVIYPTEWKIEKLICTEWLDVYRSLLNTWQMWQSRAMFDVDRAEVLRKVKQRQSELLNPMNRTLSGPNAASLTGRRGPQTGGRRTGGRLADADVQATVPANLDARCNYCASPLSLRVKDNMTSQWLSKMKPVLSCCPQCRKPLPRCAICMLSMSTLNPYLELARERSRPIRTTVSEDMSNLANIPFAEWFTWCMRCKHGGHAHHLTGWFSNHDICPVSGCDCQCQFDGVRKLNRPALSHVQNASADYNKHTNDTS